MTDFSREWLTLREPLDHASINAAVRHALVRELVRYREVSIADLGCGTGSNLRSLAPTIPCRQHWTLIDRDPKLLGAGQENTRNLAAAGVASVAYCEADLSKGGPETLFKNATLVTASALFDLFPASDIERLARAVAANRQIFYAVLTYDGIAAWIPAGPSDGTIREAFNRHQRGDKGFGPAAGPGATDALAQSFLRHGYHVIRGKSPWILDATHPELRAALDRGWGEAVHETGLVSTGGLEAWLGNRARADSISIIGHEDLLALPPALPFS